MKGIDISSHQGNVDFAKARAAGIEAVIIKVTQGNNYINPYFKNQYANAKANGLKVGFYHFMDKDGAVEEAKHFLNTVSGYDVDFKYVLDIEDQQKWTRAEASTTARAFLDYLISQGKEVAIYTGDYFYRDTLDNSVKDVPLWVANYNPKPMAINYVGWQYSETGSVPGVSTPADMDVFYEGLLLSSKKEELEVETIVVYGDKKDRNAAEIIADHYNCSTIFAQRPYDYSKIKRVICVGATPSGRFNNWTSYKTDLIQGVDEEDTVIQALKLVGRV